MVLIIMNPKLTPGDLNHALLNISLFRYKDNANF
jgi:hypothetical protein